MTRTFPVPTTSPAERWIRVRDDLPPLPERLLLAQARAKVLFICGAGISMPSDLPSFRRLVIDVYEALDSAVHDTLLTIPSDACDQWSPALSGLNSRQCAEVKRFVQGDYDVVLGMLERRIDGENARTRKVRDEIAKRIRRAQNSNENHKALLKLSNRGAATAIVTTNFDLLFEHAASRMKNNCGSHCLGGIPRPSERNDFSGVLHIHGAIGKKVGSGSDLVVTDRDFGEFYLQRRIVPDFIYDAARLYDLVLVGYSANDPPMRYLLNAVAADGIRFGDPRRRFAFVPQSNPNDIEMEDWSARGIIPIPYTVIDHAHSQLTDLLQTWALLSPPFGSKTVHSIVRRILRQRRVLAPKSDQDMFDHLVRRGSQAEREEIAKLIAATRADLGWLTALQTVCRERKSEEQQ